MSPNPGILTHEQFPCPPGNLPWSVADIAGPASYTTVSVSAGAPGGGQAIASGTLGLPVATIAAFAMGSDDGQYAANIFFNPFAPRRGQNNGIIVQWIVANTGVEVTANTNLSARTMRILAVGR